MITITEMTPALRRPATRLAARVFDYWAWYVKLAFWAYGHRENRCVKAGMRLGRIASLRNYWVAVTEAGDVCGVTGLYEYRRDRHEAVWMAWFCVDPERRGQGIGRQLIEHAIGQARAQGYRYFRLHTSAHPNEAAAQGLYEAYGFRLIGEDGLFVKTLIRELVL